MSENPPTQQSTADRRRTSYPDPTRLPPGFRGLGGRLVIEEAQCAPVLKELSRQVWLNSIGPGVQAFLDRY